MSIDHAGIPFGTVHRLQSIVGCRSEPRHTGGYPIERVCTLPEVAKALGVTKEKAWTLERSAIRKCKKFCAAHGLRLEDVLR
jgi:hypothetical protein